MHNANSWVGPSDVQHWERLVLPSKWVAHTELEKCGVTWPQQKEAFKWTHRPNWVRQEIQRQHIPIVVDGIEGIAAQAMVVQWQGYEPMRVKIVGQKWALREAMRVVVIISCGAGASLPMSAC